MEYVQVAVMAARCVGNSLMVHQVHVLINVQAALIHYVNYLINSVFASHHWQKILSQNHVVIFLVVIAKLQTLHIVPAALKLLID